MSDEYVIKKTEKKKPYEDMDNLFVSSVSYHYRKIYVQHIGIYRILYKKLDCPQL